MNEEVPLLNNRDDRCGPSFRPRSIFNPVGLSAGAPDLLLQHRVDLLVRAYRVRGHNQANVNPLSTDVPAVPELDLKHSGFTEADLDKKFVCETIARTGHPHPTLAEALHEAALAVAGQGLHIGPSPGEWP